MSIGTVLLATAFMASVISLFFTARAVSGNRLNRARVRQFSYLSAMLIFFAFLFLLFGFLNDDFSLSYVYSNSSSDLHFAYKIAALWADKAGSLLLWLLFLAVINIVVIKTEDDLENIVVGVITLTEIFLLLIILADSPFQFIWDKFPDEFQGRAFLPPGLDGLGMNPLLIDPWMVSHPPFLFLGYAAAVVPFAYAIAALLKGDSKGYLKHSYRWTLFSMVTLGIGIFLGCYWAYKVLGWGGFWGWDPVENSSLIPWLVSVALFHTMIIQKRKGALVRVNLFFSLIYLVLVFYSTFLTRSGVLANFSVHSFGTDGLSFGILFFMLFYLIVGGFLFAKRFKEFKGTPLGNKFWTWDNFTVYGVLSLTIFAGIVLIGTSMPMLSRIFSDNPAPVTANFYNNLSIPFALMILVFIVLSAIAVLGSGYKKSIAIVLGVSSVAVSLLLNSVFGGTLISGVLIAVALFVIFHCVADLVLLKNRKSLLPSRIAHIGIASLILGCVATGYFSETFHKDLIQGEETSVGPVSLTFEKFNAGEKSSLAFLMKKGSSNISFDCVYYINERTRSLYREPYVSSGLAGDIYVVVEEYTSGSEISSVGIFSPGETKTIGDCTIFYQSLRSKGMMTESPATYAEIVVNGRKLNTGIKFEQGGHRHEDPAFVPGTNRKIRLVGFDPTDKRVQLHIEPAEGAPVPADTVHVDFSLKRLMWVVWLGMILLTAGAIVAFFRKQK